MSKWKNKQLEKEIGDHIFLWLGGENNYAGKIGESMSNLADECMNFHPITESDSLPSIKELIHKLEIK